jgi:hypothetical protein
MYRGAECTALEGYIAAGNKNRKIYNFKPKET